MFGVVLWSDRADQKAVIWCEDHGDLAFYRQSGEQDCLRLDVGDWVQFDLVMERNQRLVRNPMLLEQQAYRGIQDLLRSSDASDDGDAATSDSNADSERTLAAKVIPFSMVRDREAPTGEKSKACSA